MDPLVSPKKNLKSPDTNMNAKTSITCYNVPEALFDATAAKKHFTKFGRVQKIRLFPKKQMCIIEYDLPSSTEKAVLNAGAFDGVMFDVTRTKARVRKKSKKDDDPDWMPDPDLQEELAAMSGGPTYRVPRQKAMEIEPEIKMSKPVRVAKHSPMRKKLPIKVKVSTGQPISGIEPPVAVPVTQTTMSTSEAAAELHQLRSRVSLTPDEQWRALDARDRILRAWGGTGSRVKVGGATIGTCPDMCPEKELLHRQAEHQVLTLETVVDSDGQMEPWRAVKQYSRSSADQEIPMCFELRPPAVLMRTCSYLLHEIADTRRQVSLSDWFHFMWDRLRSIRKDITQQALCCAESIRLVEMCARFHAHCAARLADLEHTQFDPKLNTDNLTKCLQTLKHMYGDVGPDEKPREAEFRGYIALLNLGDANFWWEIKQLPEEIQKSEAIVFAIKVFNAIDNNNYVRFFRLVHEKATYLQACILLRYFNDVRARALARIVKAYAPRGGSRYPVEELMNALAFESVENMKSFINHYGLRFAKVDDSELSVILDRNQFIEDSDPYPLSRAINLIESKRNSSVAEVIAGGTLPPPGFRSHNRCSSFNNDGRLKDTALVGEDMGYNTVNDSNRDVKALKTEIQRLTKGGRIYAATENKTNNNSYPKLEMKVVQPVKVTDTVDSGNNKNKYLFQPATPVAPTEILDKSPEKIMIFRDKSKFIFSKPQEPVAFDMPNSNSLFNNIKVENKNIFKLPKQNSVSANALFAQTKFDVNNDKNPNIFAKGDEIKLMKPDSTGSGNIFTKPALDLGTQNPSSIFSSFNNKNSFEPQPLLTKANNTESTSGQNAFNKLSPGSLFKSACNTVNGSEPKAYSIFHSKNKENSVAADIFKSVNKPNFGSVYDFDQQTEEQEELDRKQEEEEEEMRVQEQLKREAERKEAERKEELRRQEELRKKQEEMKRIEDKRRKDEERKQEELKKKLEEEKIKAELKRKEEDERFRIRVEKESFELVEELVDEIKDKDVPGILKEEFDKFHGMMAFAENQSEEIVTELCYEICRSEMTAEKYWTDKVMKKWFVVWKNQLMRNYKRRCFLENTPVWLTDKTPIEEAVHLRRMVEQSALKNMNYIHKGYRFTGELKLFPSPEPFNVMEIIKSPLLKRMKYINYPYDKCFFWKITLVAPRTEKWMCKKVDTAKWLLDAFCDNKKHDTSDSLIHVKKQSWNNLMDFAISVSLIWQKRHNVEALEGSNGLVFYFTEFDRNYVETIKDTLNQKYPYQIVPVAVILPKINDDSMQKSIEFILSNYLNDKVISAFKIFNIEPQTIVNSITSCTKSALKWIAKMYPQVPNVEVDLLKSLCQRYLGNEIWCKLKSERDIRVNTILKDIQRLVKCYNIAVDKLIDVVSDERLFNYPPFPLEFKEFLDSTSPYPKPYEFIPSSARNTENTSAVKDMIKQLKLPDPTSDFQAVSVPALQQQIRKYCKQIGWFNDPEEVVCKVVAVLPNEFSDLEMPREQFREHFANYNLVDVLNIIVYEKINRLNNFDNRFVIYEPSALQEFRNCNWLCETDVISRIKHKAIQYEDDLDFYLEAKRRKIALDSMDYMLEDKDATLVEENIKNHEESISKYNDCEAAVKQLEDKLEEETRKSIQLENLLRIALSDV